MNIIHLQDRWVLEENGLKFWVTNPTTEDSYIKVPSARLSNKEMYESFAKLLEESKYLQNCPMYCDCGDPVAYPGDWFCEKDKHK